MPFSDNRFGVQLKIDQNMYSFLKAFDALKWTQKFGNLWKT